MDLETESQEFMDVNSSRGNRRFLGCSGCGWVLAISAALFLAGLSMVKNEYQEMYNERQRQLEQERRETLKKMVEDYQEEQRLREWQSYQEKKRSREFPKGPNDYPERQDYFRKFQPNYNP